MAVSLRLTTLLILALAACGDDGGKTPDAPIIVIPDAPPDAPVVTCGSPMKMCGAACISVATDEDNCGDCGVACKGGEVCDTTCACPAPFVGDVIEPSGFDQFQAAGNVTVAIAPNTSASGINPLLVGYTANTPLNTNIDLSMVALGSAPFVAAAYGFQLSTMSTDANYAAIAGTLRLTSACASDAQGTITNAVFHGVTGGLLNPQLDPAGCEFTVPSIAFHMNSGPCP